MIKVFMVAWIIVTSAASASLAAEITKQNSEALFDDVIEEMQRYQNRWSKIRQSLYEEARLDSEFRAINLLKESGNLRLRDLMYNFVRNLSPGNMQMVLEFSSNLRSDYIRQVHTVLPKDFFLNLLSKNTDFETKNANLALHLDMNL